MITKTVDKIGNRGLLTSVDINEFTIQLVTHAWGTRGNYFGECYNFFVWINDELCDYSRFLTEEEAQKYFLKKVILLSKKKIPQNDLFLRSFETPGRLRAECLPKSLIKNKNYPFLKRELRDLGINRCTYLGSTDCVTKISGLAKVTITALSYDSRPDIGDYTFGKYLVLDVLHGNSD
ncbi:hypothetical protein J4456_04120 [Candidatus Pacearchaeota archaeon]|nr:hypothetical protein [Candidatus Pacearchaeota archaeon]